MKRPDHEVAYAMLWSFGNTHTSLPYLIINSRNIAYVVVSTFNPFHSHAAKVQVVGGVSLLYFAPPTSKSSPPV